MLASVMIETEVYGEYRAFSPVKITVSEVCYHHHNEIRYHTRAKRTSTPISMPSARQVSPTNLFPNFEIRLAVDNSNPSPLLGVFEKL